MSEGVLAALTKTKLFILHKINPAIDKIPITVTAKDVLFIAGVTGASKRYRVDNIVNGLTELSYDVQVIMDSQIRLIDLDALPKVVVFFRCADINYSLTSILASLLQRNVTIVADIDDLIFEPTVADQIDAYNRLPVQEQTSYREGIDGYRRVLASCRKATAATSFLASRMLHVINEATVIPNTVNDKQLRLASTILAVSPVRDTIKERLTIIYLSGTNTHQKDFEQCSSALASFMRKYPNVYFHLVGLLDLPDCFTDLHDRIRHDPLLPYLKLLSLTAAADINIAPLEKIPFNHAKSELKIFEAGLVQVPTIASPVDSYAQYIEDGVDGLLADTEEEWYNAFARLADNPDLRASMGLKAREKALQKNHYLHAARLAAEFYGLAPRWPDSQETTEVINAASCSGLNMENLRIAWLLPNLMLGSGGYRNILRAAHHLANFGHTIELYLMNEYRSGKKLLSLIQEYYYPLRAVCYPYRGRIEKNDVLLATHWSTVEPALQNQNRVLEIMYFVQDFEPYFYPMGSEYIMAENTYRQGLYHITSGPWCERFLKEEFHAEADHFLFPIDKNIYFPRERNNAQLTILFFAKPEMPRRCYELGVAALHEFYNTWHNNDVNIVFFGSRNVDTKAVPFPCTCASMLPNLDDLALLYSSADLGIVFSPTNPSLVPYEMMACGLPVLDLALTNNHYNYGQRRDIAFLADPRPAVMAEQIVKLLNNKAELELRRQNGLDFVNTFPSEEQMGRRVEALIKKRISLYSGAIPI